MQVMTGVYHDEDRAAEAIEELVQAGVPLDEVSVLVSDEAGSREVPVQEKDSVVKGAVVGGAVGSVLGGLGAALATTGVVTGPGALLLGAGPVLGMVRGVVSGGGFGYGIGVLAGLDFWKDEADFHGADLEKGAAIITVHSDDLHDTARGVFERTGADRISG